MSNFGALGRMLLRQPDFAGVLASNLALGMAYSFFIPFLSMWGTLEVGMTPHFFGFFMMASTLSGILLSTVLARWSDTRLPRKTVLIIGGSGGVVGYLAYGYVKEPYVLLAIGCTATALSAVAFSQLFAYVRETYDRPTHRDVDPSFLMSVVRVCFSLAWTVGPAIGSWVMANWSYRGVFVGTALLYVIFTLGMMRFVHPGALHATDRQTKKDPVWQILTRPSVLASFTAFMLVFAAHAMNMLNLPLTVTRVLGGKDSDLGVIFGIGPVVELPLMLWFGHLAARGHQLRLIRWGAVVTAAYFAVLGLAQVPWHVYPAQVLSGISFAILTNVTILFYQDLLPGQPGLATTIFTNSANAGNLVGYLGYGALVEKTGNRGMFWVCTGLTIVTTILLLCYRHKTGRSRAGGSCAIDALH